MISPKIIPQTSGFSHFSKTFAGTALLLSGADLAGWFTGWEDWGLLPSSANRGGEHPLALAFSALALALWLLCAGDRWRKAGRTMVWIGLILGGLNYLQPIWSAWPGSAIKVATGTLGIPTTATLCLGFIGISLIGIDHTIRDERRPTHAFALLAALTAIIALQGRLFGSSSWMGGEPYLGLSLTESAVILMIACGVLFSRKGNGALQILASEGPGGGIARRLLPLVLLITLFSETLRLMGVRAGWFDEPFAKAAQSTLRVLVVGYLIWRISVGLERTDTQRRTATRLLIEEEKGAREALESLPQIVWSCAPDGNCDYLSPQWENYTGNPPALGLGYGWQHQLHPEDQENARRRWAETANEGRSFDMELRIRRHDGFYRWFKTRSEPLRGNDGQIRKWFGTHTDIDDRVRIEAALAESNARTEAIFRASHDAFLVTDPEGRILDTNPAITRLLGYERQHLLSMDLTRIEPDGKLATAARELGQRLGREGELFETRLTSREGQAIDVEAAIAPLHRAGQTRIITALRDITGRRKAEEALRQANDELERRVQERTSTIERSNRDLEQFAYVASHDLQEPLRAVAGCAQLLKRRYSGQLDAGADELINHLVTGAVRMQNLIQDLLTYARLDRRETTGIEADADLALKSALAQLEVSIRESSATVTVEGELPRVRADRAQLVLLFQNLIGNSLKYRSSSPPIIRISVVRTDGNWEFAIEDNGIGIEPRHQERIFVIFQRLHAQGEYAGTGIGLAVCKKIVERHGGRIWVESKLGLGSTFRFTLPPAT